MVVCMILHVSELMEKTLKLLQRVELHGFSVITLENDWFSTIVAQDSCCKRTEVPRVLIGSLFDDVEFIRKILKRDLEPTTYEFERLGNIILQIAKQHYNMLTIFEYVTPEIVNPPHVHGSITLVELKELAELLQKRVLSKDIDEINLSVDCYWKVSLAKRDDVRAHGKDILQGSLYHDVYHVLAMPCLSSFPSLEDFECLGNALNQVGEEIFRIGYFGLMEFD